ncbi:hypothetical protein N665_0056s0033 [Sinapis alba]|nr:hypothetical protein N665_0056s0033 [Sinapis alba]
MDSLELPKRIFTLGEEPFPIKSIAYHTDDSKLFSAVRDALHDDEYEELKESRLGVFLKFKEMDFGWASRLVNYMLCFQLNIKKKYELWSLVGADPVRFSLIEFEQLTGLNCEYIEHLENPRCEVTNEMASFWEWIGVSVDAGPSSEQIIRALKRCQEWSQDDRMRLGYLAIFSGFIEGRKYSSATRASLARLVMDLERFENYPWGRVAFKVLMDSLRAKDFTKSYTVDGFIQVLQTRVINYVERNIEEMFPKWDNDREDVTVENIIQVMFNAPPNWKWTMNCWEDEGIYQWTNPKTHVVYVKEESSAKSLVVREEDIERPSKRARIEAPAEPRSEDIPDYPSGAIPDARSEASIPVSGVDKAYIEKCFKDLTDVMRDEFGTCLKEMKLLGNRMDVVEKKLGITGKESSSHDLQQTTSSLPKRRLEHGSESVNGAKARQDEEPSSSKALSVEAKEKEVKEGKEELKEKELKEKANKGLEKALAKVKEAKANEAKANEAKAKEAKAKEKEAKAKEKEAKEKEEKEAKEKEEKEAKLAAEDWLGEAKLEEEAKAKEAADKGKEPDESAAEASVVLMDKDEDTVSDVKMHEARRLAKKDSALAAIRGRSERDRKLAPSQQSPFQGNSTAKLIIPNTKVGHGYDPFALPDKQLTKALMDHVKKILFWDDFTEDFPEDLRHMDAYINVLRLRQQNNPNHFRSERICFLDHLFSRMWRDKYGEFKSSEPDHNGLGRRLPGGSWDLYAGIVPIFCASNKTVGVDIDEIYAPVNFQNDHWIAIWISIPKRHIVVWDSIVKHISKAELDEIMEPFLTMVPYLLVECASTDEERIKYSLEPFTYERPTVGVPQCIAGDCGVYALKYMECHALGFMPNIFFIASLICCGVNPSMIPTRSKKRLAIYFGALRFR